MVRLTLPALAGASLLAMTAGASAEPISGLIVSTLLPSLVGTAIGSVVTGAITLGLGLGVSYLANALFAPKPQMPKPTDVQGVVRQSIAPRWRHYGRRKIGGSLLFIETQSGNLAQIIAFAAHRIDAVEEWILDNRNLALDAEGFVTSSPYPSGKVQIQHRLGTATQTAYATLIERFPTLWTPQHRAAGIAHAMLLTKGVDQEDFNKAYPNRIASLNAVMRGALVFDPRTQATAYSANLALIMRDYLTHEDGLQIGADYIEDEDFIQAANDADDILPTKAGGTVRRYHGALSVSFEAEPQSVIDRLILATDGRLCLRPNGKVGFTVGKWREPTIVLNDDDHIIDYELADSGGPLREFNEVIVKYEEPLAGFAAVQAQPWRDEADIDAHGEVRTRTIEAYEIQHNNHACRIAKVAAARAAPRWQGTLKTNLAGMQAWDEEVIRVRIADLDSDEAGAFDETMEVLGVSLDQATMTVAIQVASLKAEARAFNPQTEEGTPPVVPEQLEEGATPSVSMATAIGTQRNISGGTKVALIKAYWARESDRDDLRPEVQYSQADAESWQGVAVASGASSIEIVGLEDGTSYDVRIRWRGSTGSAGPWALIENIPANADPTPPAVPTRLKVESGPISGQLTVSMRTPNSANFKSVRVLRAPTNDLAAAVDISGAIYAAPSVAVFFEDEPGTGTWRYWVTAENASGVKSATVGPVSGVIP